MSTTALGATLAAGLIQVGLELVNESIVKPALQPEDSRLAEFLKRGPQRRQAERRLQQLVAATLVDMGAPPTDPDWAGWAARLGFDKLQGAGPEAARLRLLAAKTALLLRAPDPAEIPRQVSEALRWPPTEHQRLARFLYTLQQKLAADADWGSLVAYCQRAAVRDHLSLAVRSLEHIEAYLAALTQFYGLASAADEEDALRDFLELVRRQHRQLSFVFVKPRRRDDPLPEAELEAVFVPLQVDDPHVGRGDAGRKGGQARRAALLDALEGLAGPTEPDPDSARPITIEEALARYPACVLRGEPGSGKTTLLKHLALSFAHGAARERLGWGEAPLLPILVPLRNFSRHLQRAPVASLGPRLLRDYIESYFRDYDLELPPGFFKRRLEQGRCLVLLDGLDEVADRGQRIRVAEIVNEFVKHYLPHGNRFMLASRPKGYDEVADALPRLTVCQVQRLTPQGRDTLVRNLMRQFDADRRAADSRVEDLLDDIRHKDRVDELSRIPLFATTLVLVFHYGGAALPERRVDVYQELVNLLLGFWEIHRADREGTVEARELAQADGTGRLFRDEREAVEAKERALVHVAAWMQQRGATEVARAEVEAELGRYFEREEGAPADQTAAWARGFLRVAHERSGLYVEQDPDTFAFAHKNFLEYLVATHLVGLTDDEMLATVQAHAGDEWWHEVILLAAAHDALKTPRRKLLFQTLLETGQVVLAGECAVDAGARLPPPARTAVETALYAQMTDSARPPQQRYTAGLQWDALHGPPEDVNAWVRCPACGDGRVDLYVGKYPVTNAQYALFIQAGGYEDDAFWGGADGVAWRWKQTNHGDYRGSGALTQPEYWREARFGKERRGFPVVGVSWYEAQAYCLWLTRLLERWRAADESLTPEERALVAGLWQAGGRSARLPGAEEWTRLAGGAAGGRYPWDRPGAPPTSEKDRATITARANVREAEIGGTTPVAMYPAGAAHPFGLYDVAGNVWEWLNSWYDETEKRYKALRGGSWSSSLSDASVSARYDSSPSSSNYHVGFRVVSPVFLAAGS